MLLDLRTVRGSTAVVRRAYPPAEVAAVAADAADGGEALAVTEPVMLSLRVTKDGDRYRLRGQLEAAVRRECCRCLDPFEASLAVAIDVRYLPQRANTGDGEHEIAEDDLSIAFYRDDHIDLGALVREQLQLAAPMKPLCRAACRGLCPQCGTNLNRTVCGCDTAWHDPRLEILRSIVPGAADAEPGPADAGRTRKG